MTELRLAGVIRESIVDGPGIRMVVFAQGCPHKCKGCQNPDTHSFDGGYLSSVENIINAAKQNPMLKGITFSGGDPFMQAEAFAQLGKQAHSLGLNIMVYTGFTFEKLTENFDEHPDWKHLLEQTDILMDGPFILEQKSMMLKFRGSKNQRAINVQDSLKENKIIEAEL